ncbi:MAG TPA: hypothetical protein VFZ42_11440 [Chitinophagaceae bacterium]
MIRTLIISLLVLVIASCNKNDDDEATILGHWLVENYTEKEYDNNMLINTVVEPGGGIAYEFRSNGELIITTPGEPAQSYFYTLPAENKIIISGQEFELRGLTTSAVALYARDDFGPGSYEEAIINLRR